MSKVPGTQEAFREHYESYYTEASSAWRRVAAIQKAENVISLWKAAHLQPLPTVCEIGCGDGAILQQLDALGFPAALRGVEVSATGLERARQRSYRVPATFAIADGASLPDRSGAYDLALLSHVVEHAADPRALIREAARVGRFVFIEVPLELHLRTPRDFKWTAVGHINLYNPTVLRHLVQSCGLRVLAERMTGHRYSVYRFHHSALSAAIRYCMTSGLLWLAPRFAFNIFTYHGCILATAMEGERVIEPPRPTATTPTEPS